MMNGFSVSICCFVIKNKMEISLYLEYIFYKDFCNRREAKFGDAVDFTNYYFIVNQKFKNITVQSLPTY